MVIILGTIIFFVLKSQTKEDANLVMWNLKISDIDNNINSLSLKKGNYLDIYIKDSNLNNSEFKNPFIENAKIKNFRTKDYQITKALKDAEYIEFSVPYKYVTYINALPTYSSITLTLQNSTKKSKTIKVNDKIYNLLKEKYEIKND